MLISKIMIPRLYKRHKILLYMVLVTLSVVLSFGNYWMKAPVQASLEDEAFRLTSQSSFNPRAVFHELTSYIIAFNDGDSNEISNSRIGTKSGSIFFHWDDWVDTFPANRLLEDVKLQSPEGKCDSALEKFASVNAYWLESYHTKVRRGMAHLYCSQQPPKRILLATDFSFVEVPVDSKRRLGLSDMPSNISKSQVVKDIQDIQMLDRQRFNTIPYKNLRDRANVDVQDFYFDPQLEIIRLKQQQRTESLDSSQEDYLKFLSYANKLVDNTDQYFKYPWITSDLIVGYSHHFAFPFFKRYYGNRERQSVLQHLVRAWFQFAESAGVASWINYGSLLGWAYNGVNMPWDTDIDIQMPITHLSKLGREFNRTLITENPRYGNARYYLEVSPTYLRQGNSKNFIDARFIEINSGLYIDISALSHTNFKPPKNLYDGLTEEEKERAIPINCKNWNWHITDEILPLRHSYFEGGDVYIPNNVSRLLSRKYGESSYTTKLQFKKFNYQTDIDVWVPDSICSKPPRTETRYKDENKDELTLNGACGSEELKDEYRIIRECAQRRHNLEPELDYPKEYDINSTGALPYFRKDPWDYHNDINKGVALNSSWYTRDEVYYL
ncbi:Piso0_005099 [Millerozyma farinosa CBS 7064]|uniref:Piso0_005099 protein n=1 Tax=Pichia sorbitophila (strain ATCC MYA-4447 / BCRC 22081 / CBS 7064 / NBRC 10061 / NRRL Y-12695) TaxID=559304 RepID=G8Y198_PICSO|nr:Piso0_005099 [Millerozyma farinosa CBS 7064]